MFAEDPPARCAGALGCLTRACAQHNVGMFAEGMMVDPHFEEEDAEAQGA